MKVTIMPEKRYYEVGDILCDMHDGHDRAGNPGKPMNDCYYVLLHSEKYGKEEFTYGTLGEAREAFRRLSNEAHKHTKEDDIERTVILALDYIITEGRDET